MAPSADQARGRRRPHPAGQEGLRDRRAPCETDELPGIVADYVAAARRAKAAGFDGVEIHSANGYLLDQFLQSKTNHRDDAYGGSVENRFRLLREVVEGVSDGLRRRRASACGWRPTASSTTWARPTTARPSPTRPSELDAYGLAYLHVMDGLAFGFHELGEPMTLEDFRAVFSRPADGQLRLHAGDRRGRHRARRRRPDRHRPAVHQQPRPGRALPQRLAAGPRVRPGHLVLGRARRPKGYTDFPTYAKTREQAV